MRSFNVSFLAQRSGLEIFIVDVDSSGWPTQVYNSQMVVCLVVVQVPYDSLAAAAYRC